MVFLIGVFSGGSCSRYASFRFSGRLDERSAIKCSGSIMELLALPKRCRERDEAVVPLYLMQMFDHTYTSFRKRVCL